MSELKGCPICGGEMHFEDFDQMPCPVCEKCGCVFSFYKEDYSEEEVAELFNSRPIEDSLRARIGELEKEISPFRDPYFKDLSMSAIAELAKKSIRLADQHNKDTERIGELEAENKRFRDDLEEMAKGINGGATIVWDEEVVASDTYVCNGEPVLEFWTHGESPIKAVLRLQKQLKNEG